MPNDGGPPNKYTKFHANDLTSGQVLEKLNELADQGYNSSAVAVKCVDGTWVFVGGYGN